MKVCFLLAIFMIFTVVGYKLINEVPSLLHTPLMSGMNALSGVTVLGSLVATASAVLIRNQFLGALAITLATINLVGGFVITDRMLKMFKAK